jgi:low affinity Fe/Cu permease
MIAAGIVLVWAVTGPIFHYSDTWQLVINTGTTIVTFLMFFLIQNSQNRASAAIQVKLDELIRVSAAHNSFVRIEHLSEDELDEIRAKCERRAEAEKVGEETVKSTGKKAKRAADLVTECEQPERARPQRGPASGIQKYRVDHQTRGRRRTTVIVASYTA